MIREGAPDVTLRFLAESPKRLAISQFTEAQTQGLSIRRYFEYLLERVKAYQSTKTDFVRTGAGHMKSLTVDKGLLRHTEIVQTQIRALLKCDFLGGAEPDNEISMTAFRLVTLDLLELFKVMNEGTINVLEHYFEMSKVDAQRSLDIYKTFARQTDMVVQYLSTARQYQAATRLEVPKLKHAPTTLTSSLEDYLNDPDFDINRRQYLAQQEAKRTGRPVAAITSSAPAAASASASVPRANVASAGFPTAPARTAQQPKGPAPDLIDFFESIEQNQQPMAQQAYAQEMSVPQQGYQIDPNYAQAQFNQQPQVPQQTGYNPFAQNFPQQPNQQTQLQPDFTGAGFGGYGPQPPQNGQNVFGSQLSSIPQGGIAEFQQQPFDNAQQPQIQSPQMLQPQQTGTNPFRQSMMPTGTANLNRQSTNPFAKHSTGFAPGQSFTPPPATIAELPQQQFSPQQQESPMALQPQKTGTNPFAKNNLSPPPNSPLSVNVTGSTNPFRQSQFVNQQTGQGWQHTNQGTFSGFDINSVPTTNVFPRPGAQQT